jgi:flagellin-like hook-associated protein FlgL
MIIIIPNVIFQQERIISAPAEIREMYVIILNVRTFLENLANANRQRSLALLNGLPKRGFVPGNIFHIQSGANENDGFKLDIGTTSVGRLGLNTIDMRTRESATRGITVLDDALDSVSAQRAMIGAQLTYSPR